MKNIKDIKSKIINKLNEIYFKKNEDKFNKIKNEKSKWEKIYTEQKYKGTNPLLVLIQELKNNEISKKYSILKIVSFATSVLTPSVFLLNFIPNIGVLMYLALSSFFTFMFSVFYSIIFENDKDVIFAYETEAASNYNTSNENYNKMLIEQSSFHNLTENLFSSKEKLAKIDLDILKKCIDKNELYEILDLFNDNEIKKLFEIAYNNNDGSLDITYSDIIQAIKYNENYKLSNERFEHFKGIKIKEKEFSIL
jgi:hypothetical protein